MNIDNEQKKKFVLMALLVLLVGGFFYFKYSSGKTKDKGQVTMPKAKSKIDEKKAYDSKIATTKINTNEKDTLIPKQNTYFVKDNNKGEKTVQKGSSTYSSRTQKRQSYTNQRQTTPNNNSYNPYARREQWAKTQRKQPEVENKQVNDIPQNKSNSSKSKESKKEELSFFEQIDKKENTTEIPQESPRTLNGAIRNKFGSQTTNQEQKEILAVIHNDQKISGSDTRVRLRLLRPIQINSTTIGTDAFLYANAKYSQTNIELELTNLSYKGKNYPFNYTAYDYLSGMKGIQVNEDNIIGKTEEVMERQGQNQIRGAGVIGQVVSGIFQGRNRQAKILLFDEHKLYLKPNRR